jgi:hypothetical protein
MSLGEWQSALGTLVVTRASSDRLDRFPWALFAGCRLNAEQRNWLEQLVGSPGFEVTCLVQRWWRETRLRWAIRLTLPALGPDQATEVINTYLNTIPVSSLFFFPEALGFLDFILQLKLEIPHVNAIAHFERAMFLAAEAASLPLNHLDGSWPQRTPKYPNPASTVVVFDTDPEKLLKAILTGKPLPEPGPQKTTVLVSSTIPCFWRVLNKEEELPPVTGNRCALC